VRQRAVFQIGDDLFNDRVVAVGGLGVEHRLGAVGEHRVIPVGGEQLVLPRGCGGGVEATHPAHDQPGGDVLGGTSTGERGKGTSATSASEIQRCSA
jgi:hypothetical protein